MLEEIKRCCIQPLQIVKEQCKWVFPPREDAEEAPENRLEAGFRVLRLQIQDRLGNSGHRLQLGNEIHHELDIRAERFAQGVPPPTEISLALAQERTHETLERLCQGGVWDV